MTTIIIEGPDLSGKTYAIEKIAKHFNSGFVLKNSFKPKSLLDTNKIFAQYWNILSIIDGQKGLIILDRFYPSQAVYSYLRGEDDFDRVDIQALETICSERGILYVYLDTPRYELENRYDKRGDEHIKKGQLRELKERYDEFYELSILKKIKVNTMDEGWLIKLEGWLNEHK